MNKKTIASTSRRTRSKSVDSDAVRHLADLLDETGLTEIEYEEGNRRIRVSRQHGTNSAETAAAQPPPAGASAPQPAPSLAPVAPEIDASHPGAVTSPMVGTIYLAPEPGSPNFVAPGDTVSEGQTLMLVEAMKTYNEIKAHKAGTIVDILIENTQPVEFGDVLAIIE